MRKLEINRNTKKKIKGKILIKRIIKSEWMKREIKD